MGKTTLSHLDTATLHQRLLFLYEQSGKILQNGEQQLLSSIQEQETEIRPGLFASEPICLTPNFFLLRKLGPTLHAVRLALKELDATPRSFPNPPQLTQWTDVLRCLLETVFDQDLTFRGEEDRASTEEALIYTATTATTTPECGQEAGNEISLLDSEAERILQQAFETTQDLFSPLETLERVILGNLKEDTHPEDTHPEPAPDSSTVLASNDSTLHSALEAEKPEENTHETVTKPEQILQDSTHTQLGIPRETSPVTPVSFPTSSPSHTAEFLLPTPTTETPHTEHVFSTAEFLLPTPTTETPHTEHVSSRPPTEATETNRDDIRSDSDPHDVVGPPLKRAVSPPPISATPLPASSFSPDRTPLENHTKTPRNRRKPFLSALPNPIPTTFFSAHPPNTPNSASPARKTSPRDTKAPSSLVSSSHTSTRKPNWEADWEKNPQDQRNEKTALHAAKSILLPYGKNPAFLGRDRELMALQSGLEQDGLMVLLPHDGTSGLGITALAAEYAHSQKEQYDIIWWIFADYPATISQQCAVLADKLGHPPGPDGTTDVSLESLLADSHRWLLIFDNACTPETLKPFLPHLQRSAQPNNNAHIIVTSRYPYWPEAPALLTLYPLLREDAARFLRNQTGNDDREITRVLADELGRAPGTLEHAAAVIKWEADHEKASSSDISAYLDRFRTQKREWTPENFVTGSSINLITAVALSHELLFTTDRERKITRHVADELLYLAAFMGSSQVPLSLLLEHGGCLPSTLKLRKASRKRDQLISAIRLLSSLSFVKIDQDGFRVEPHIGRALIDRLAPPSRQGWIQTTVNFLATVFPSGTQKNDIRVLLLPHVLAAVSHSMAFDCVTPAAVTALKKAADHLQQQGNQEEAQILVTQATIAEKQFAEKR